ncbi:adenine-specific DNA methylase [Burkholderia pseudomallei]|uniref:site-specific DNA-methyltransferase n=1 Tax=Burkholderia pseudomallei TaxID=28450 RepID=UPI0005DBAE67|nr:site-specific DNA-methyltransferase [Burkholderia pseudomallei]CAJ3557090.1 adenine-specific DNA methylase [Burkholderia pseudomallei]CAJ3596957.1 adenine-specific DNA methylase [Burkholderia pseudomallei]CAJ3652254.1 adenine-specific DNA methylase [Burkholderia pseudomallei]CAJ3794060.1 adenine-specific DNA methylase [Burkholderia pseudomallei]CAJ3883626.1 adenine-specific DNA methylase [Burkholderia pseudomallei]
MSKQKLELTWIGKEKRPKLEPRILLEDPEKTYHAKHRVSDSDIFDNRLVFGDNLLALKALEQEFTGKIKCVYIDPPYNTGSAFTHYDDGLEHSIWLGLMRDRLEIIKRLLHPTDGSLWVSIDDYEAPYLRVLLDEVFGRRCFIASNVWQKRYSRENREAIGDVHEYILTYAVDPMRFKQIRNKVPPTPEQTKVYRNPNNDPRGPWRPIPMTAQEGHATKEQFYEITSPSGAVFTPPKGRCWGLSKATFERLRAEGRIYFGKNGDSQPNVIRYLSEIEGYVPWTWWPHDEVGHTDESKKEIHALFGKVDAFDTPKPERLMKRVLEIATNPGDLVLDSFAGSGTTGAVAHKMGRRWIMVELGEHCHSHIIPRLKKVIDGEDNGGISEAVKWQGGGGFRYYRLAPSLIVNDRWGNPVVNPEYNAAQLAEALAKLEGFTYAPSEVHWWQHGHSSERDFIYVTTQNLAAEQLQALSEEVSADQSLLVCCSAFRGVTAAKAAERWPNLTLKKIPKMVLARCEWGQDDYSLNVANLPMADIESTEFAADPDSSKKIKSRNAALASAGQGGLFEENE